MSALLDSEVNEQELGESLEQIQQDSSPKETFSRYSLIGDVLRNEQFVVAETSFADGIRSAIENLEQDSSVAPDSKVVTIASHPKWYQKLPAQIKNLTQSNTGKGIAQMAIAASVALVAVIGVNNLSTSESGVAAPVASTVPFGDGIQTVSGFSKQPQNKLSANQVTQSRINSLISDHEQQLRVVAEDQVEDGESETINE